MAVARAEAAPDTGKALAALHLMTNRSTNAHIDRVVVELIVTGGRC